MFNNALIRVNNLYRYAEVFGTMGEVWGNNKISLIIQVTINNVPII